MSCIDIPVIVLLLQGIPEQIGLVTLAYAIAKVPFKWKELVPMGIILALAANLIRTINLPFGTHTLIILISLFAFLTLYKKSDVDIAIISCILSFFALGLSEFVCLTTLMKVFNLSYDVLFTNLFYRIVFTEPQVILLFVMAFIIRWKRGSNDESFGVKQ